MLNSEKGLVKDAVKNLQNLSDNKRSGLKTSNIENDINEQRKIIENNGKNGKEIIELIDLISNNQSDDIKSCFDKAEEYSQEMILKCIKPLNTKREEIRNIKNNTDSHLVNECNQLQRLEDILNQKIQRYNESIKKTTDALDITGNNGECLLFHNYQRGPYPLPEGLRLFGQQDQRSCGHACLCMLADGHGVNLTEQDSKKMYGYKDGFDASFHGSHLPGLAKVLNKVLNDNGIDDRYIPLKTIGSEKLSKEFIHHALRPDENGKIHSIMLASERPDVKGIFSSGHLTLMDAVLPVTENGEVTEKQYTRDPWPVYEGKAYNTSLDDYMECNPCEVLILQKVYKDLPTHLKEKLVEMQDSD